ncbi:hypothetical protein FRC07_005598 [Ceratobasidium sp. 392]|nr:hypothetical protein FRC07_005598 [Ceratobasidium sp. 392]
MDPRPPPGRVPSLPQIYYMNGNMKRLGLASFTFLIYDLVLTLPAEMEHIWGTRWTFARVVFHANRLLGVFGTTMLVFLSFTTELSDQTYKPLRAGVLIMRVWAMYGARPWLLRILWFMYFLLIVPCLVLISIRISSDQNILPNIAPGIITGCRFRPLIYFNLSYITSFVFETTVFGMTVYKIWKMSRTPLMKRLTRDGSYYYLFIFVTLLSMAASFAYPPANFLVSGSGIFLAAMSSMCSRMILSGLSYDDTVIIMVPPVEMRTMQMPSVSFASEERHEPPTPTFALRSSKRIVYPAC